MKTLDGIKLFKELFSYILKNSKIFITLFLIFGAIFTSETFFTTDVDYQGENLFVSWGSLAVTLLKFYAPFLALCLIFEKIHNKEPHLLKEMLIVPIRFKTYLYAMMISLAVVIPLFIAFQVIPENFIIELQNFLKSMGEMYSANVSSENQQQIIQNEMNQKIEQLKANIPYLHIGIAATLFLILTTIATSISLLTFPLMFSDQDDSPFVNLKIAFLLFIKNYKGLVVYNIILLSLFVFSQIISTYDIVEIIINSFMAVFVLFSMSFIFRKTLKYSKL